VFSGTFLDVNHFSGMVESSNLLLRHPNTSVDVVEGLKEARSDKSRNKSLPGRPGNHDFRSNRVFWHVSGRKPFLAQNLDLEHVSGRKSFSRDS